jgi:4-alpha-glucanotransferase
MDANHGIYVRYRAEELYAILAVESHRSRSIIVGEDLGIVPSYIRPTMSRHGLHRMYVLRYELADNAPDTVGHIPRSSVASLNTHDMPPFASFWEDLDIGERKSLGQLDEKDALIEGRTRRSVKNALIRFLQDKGFLHQGEKSTREILKACLAYLSNSRARIILVNLEDLWLETRSQNVPGTGNEYPNWRRKARYSLEEFCQIPEVTGTLREIDNLRKRKKSD